MKIAFRPMTPEMVEYAYEDYRSSGLKDSPVLAFSQLPEADRQLEIERATLYRKLIVVATEVVGWIGVRPRPELGQIHVGFALFSKFRGKGLMKPILTKRIEVFAKEEYETLRREFPIPELYATAEKGNIPSIRTLEGCGFLKTELEPFPKGFDGIVFRLRLSE
ncbi:MAG: GNAT family N-acetyltransferase [Deltaproteobacteria bacterium]|nr:GNAT family N-acetyltransferase [Deltaproteobacteria bacterium]